MSTKWAWLAVVGLAACGGGQQQQQPVPDAGPSVTYWQNAAPIMAAKCTTCHQQGGIGPFRLDDYTTAKTMAAAVAAQVSAGTMPPYFMQHDGSCGSFHDEGTLTEEEKTTLLAWANGDRAEGTPVQLQVPDKPKLEGAVDVSTPHFSPVAAGGALAEHDEYRCFDVGMPNTTDQFLTGYDVSPGDPSIVHHTIMFVVDPNLPGADGRTNGAIMADLHANGDGRDGYPCFGGPGDAVRPSAVPVTWAPGQGVVTYPDGMGVPIHPTDRLIVQMHYNLADPGSAGKSDQTTLHLRFAPAVQRQLVFALPDPFLNSLGNPTPDMLPPGNTDAKYTWKATARQLGMDGIPYADLIAVLPHMHGRGLRQELRLGSENSTDCAANLTHWDFHWQEFYFYKAPPRVTPDTMVQVTCEYDTSQDTAPVLPGWGTQNEMCLTVLMLALP